MHELTGRCFSMHTYTLRQRHWQAFHFCSCACRRSFDSATRVALRFRHKLGHGENKTSARAPGYRSNVYRSITLRGRVFLVSETLLLPVSVCCCFFVYKAGSAIECWMLGGIRLYQLRQEFDRVIASVLSDAYRLLSISVSGKEIK